MFWCALFRVEEDMRELERRKQSLLMQYKQHKKRGSDSSSHGSQTPGKKSSVGSMEGVLSPPLNKRVVRLREYEEGDLSVSGTSTEKDAAAEGDPPTSHTPPNLNLKISEFERRVKEDLEAGLSGRHHPQAATMTEKGEELSSTPGLSQNWSKSSSLSASGGSGTSPLHLLPHHGGGGGAPPPSASTSTSLVNSDLPRHSPGMEKWSATSSSSSPSELNRTVPQHPSAQPTFCPFPLPTSPTMGGKARFSSSSGVPTGLSRNQAFSHSDSNEWTEFACASVSGSSVEVGGGAVSTVSSPYVGGGGGGGGGGGSSEEISEFDPIRTRSNSNLSSAGGDHPSKPSMIS